MNRALAFTIAILSLIAGLSSVAVAQVKPGDVITKESAGKVADLVSPGNYFLVRQGMEMRIVATKDYIWPAPYKRATEQYSTQVGLGANGDLTNYRAGLPFPMLDANDPKIAQKIMWNFAFGPAYTDDLDSRDNEIATYEPGHQGVPTAVYPVGNLAVYRNVGRTEVSPVPTDHDGDSGIMERLALGTIIVPIEPPYWQTPWSYMVRYRYTKPGRSDLAWSGFTLSRWYGEYRGMIQTSYLFETAFFGTLDFNSIFGFAGNFQDFDFKYLGEKDMLACVHAVSLPAKSCAADGGRTICPEDWEMRHVYVIEADARKPSRYGDIPAIARRILYIDSQGWFITASDQYDHGGNLWKTLAIFNTVRDREYPNSKAAVYSFDRLFQTALVDEDVQSGYSTIFFTPNPEQPPHDTWFINQAIISRHWIVPDRFDTYREYFY
jgi:hypothetical protein